MNCSDAAPSTSPTASRYAVIRSRGPSTGAIRASTSAVALRKKCTVTARTSSSLLPERV